MRILVIDNNIDPKCWGAADLTRFARKAPGATVYVRRAPDGDLPESVHRFDRIVISGSKTSALDGSPWVGRLEALIREAIDAGKPVLGVCYGHQMLARALGGEDHVRRAALGEIGWTRIEMTAESRLFRGLPRVFHSFSSHFDEVARLPQGMKLVARSERCGIQACELEGRPVFGIQFHPEKELSETPATFENHRKQGHSHLLLNEDEGKRLYDPGVGETIFRNFFEL